MAQIAVCLLYESMYMAAELTDLPNDVVLIIAFIVPVPSNYLLPVL